MSLQNEAAPVNGVDAPSPKKIDAVTDAQRTEHNVETAGLAIGANIPVIPLKVKVPLALMFPRLDTGITPAQREAAVKAWRLKHGYADNRPPFAYGSTLDGDKLNDWHSRKRSWTLAFGVSPGLVNAVVVDCDDVGGAMLQSYLIEHGEPLDISITPITRSGRNGWHVWYDNPDGLGNCNLKAEVAADVKGVGGQVLLPGMWLGDDGKGSGERRYEQLPGTPELFGAIQARTLPALPTCLRQLIEARGKHREIRDNDPDMRDAMQALKDGPATDKMLRDTEAMREALQACSPWFDALWREGADHDGSTNRFNAAGALVRHFGADEFDVHDLDEVFRGWEHATGSKDEFDNRDVSRCYVKAVRSIVTGDAFGVADDPDDGEEPDPASPARWDAARDAYGRLLTACALDDGVAEAGEELVAECVAADLKVKPMDRVKQLIADAQAHPAKSLPGTLDDAVKPAKADKPPRGIALPGDEPFRDLADIPRVAWLAYPVFSRGVVGALAGPAGAAKTRFATAECFAIVTGRPEFAGWGNDAKPVRSSVWFHCQEDPRDEMDRKLAALAHHHKIERRAYDGSEGFKFHRTSGLDSPITLAWRDLVTRAVVVNPKLHLIVDFIRTNKIGLFVLDPAIELHELDENNAAEMRIVWGAARSIADATGAHVLVLAHTRKPDSVSNKGLAGDMNVLRGSGAVAGVIRMARTVLTMSEEEAASYGLEPEKRYGFMRVDDAKNNSAAMRHGPRWFHKFEVKRNDDPRDNIAVTIPHSFDPKGKQVRAHDLAEAVGAVVADKFGIGNAHPLKAVVEAVDGLGEKLVDKRHWSQNFCRIVLGGKPWMDTSKGRLGLVREGKKPAHVLLKPDVSEAFTPVSDDDQAEI